MYVSDAHTHKPPIFSAGRQVREKLPPEKRKHNDIRDTKRSPKTPITGTHTHQERKRESIFQARIRRRRRRSRKNNRITHSRSQPHTHTCLTHQPNRASSTRERRPVVPSHVLLSSPDSREDDETQQQQHGKDTHAFQVHHIHSLRSGGRESHVNVDLRSTRMFCLFLPLLFPHYSFCPPFFLTLEIRDSGRE